MIVSASFEKYTEFLKIESISLTKYVLIVDHLYFLS